MPRRIELELTSERPDGTWTWRAAGAREPKGELDGSLLPSGAKVGDVLRAEADFDIEGITVLSVLPPKGAKPEPERIEIIGPEREFQPVTSTLAGRRERSDRRPPRRDRDDRDRPPRGPRDRDRERPDRERPDRPRAERPARPRRERPAPPPPKPKPKKLRPGRAHRDALVEALSPEQQPIAEQLFRGGIPGVRAALDEQNAAARTEGKPEVPAGTVMQIAETLVARVRVADWLDRAEAALAGVEEIALRDLRAVVASADDVARDDATRELAAKLKEALARRTAAEQDEWLRDVEQSLAAGRVVRALRLSSRPPQPGENLPPELTTRLAEAAGAAMTAEIAPDRWATLLDAVAYSPVRRDVTPAGTPAEPGDELLATVRKHAGRASGIAKLFGVEPPPPAAKRGGKRAGPKRAASPAAPGGALRRPPKPQAGPIPSPVLGRRIPPPPRPPSSPPPPPPAPPATESGSDAPPAPAPTETPAGAAEETPHVAPAAEAPPSEGAAADAPAPEAPAAEVAPSEGAAATPPEAPPSEGAAADAPAPEAPPADAPAPEVPATGADAPTHAGGLAAEGAAREAAGDAVPETVEEPVVGDDAPGVPADTAPEAAPQVETVEEPVAGASGGPPATEPAPAEPAPEAPPTSQAEAPAASEQSDARPVTEPEAPAASEPSDARPVTEPEAPAASEPTDARPVTEPEAPAASEPSDARPAREPEAPAGDTGRAAPSGDNGSAATSERPAAEEPAPPGHDERSRDS